MDNSYQRDVLDKIGKFIGFKQILLFTVLMLYVCHVTYNSSGSAFCGANVYGVCRVFTMLLLVIISTMFILSFILALGISMRQSEYLRPWLLTTIVMVALGIAVLTMAPDDLQIILGSVVLFIQFISWYPIYRLHQRYCYETKIRDQQRRPHPFEGNCFLSALAIVPGVPYYAEFLGSSMGASEAAYSEKPPSYNEVMGIDSNPPSFADVQSWSAASTS